MTPQPDSRHPPPPSHLSPTKFPCPLRQTSQEGPPGTDRKAALDPDSGSAELLVLNKSPDFNQCQQRCPIGSMLWTSPTPPAQLLACWSPPAPGEGLSSPCAKTPMPGRGGWLTGHWGAEQVDDACERDTARSSFQGCFHHLSPSRQTALHGSPRTGKIMRDSG